MMESVMESLYDTVFGQADYAPLYGATQGVLLSRPRPLARLCVLEVRYGGDKAPDGHRADTVSICNGVVLVGAACEPVFYSDEHLELLREYLTACDGVIVRIAPGVYPGVTHQALHALLREMAAAGKTILPHPDVEDVMRSKRALCKVGALQCGLPDSLVYTSREQMWQGFRRTAAFQPRVMTLSDSVGGEGVWLVRLKSGEYCSTLGQRELGGDELLVLQEMNDGHREQHTAAEFVEFCALGARGQPTTPAWKATAGGGCLSEGKCVGGPGQVVDQRWLPRVVEGEVRCVMVGGVCIEVVHKQTTAVEGTTLARLVYAKYKPDDLMFAPLMRRCAVATYSECTSCESGDWGLARGDREWTLERWTNPTLSCPCV